MLRQAIFAVVHIDHNAGPGSIQVLKELFLATQGAVRRPHHRRDAQRSALLRRLCRLAAGRAAPGEVDRDCGTSSRPTPTSSSARIRRDSGRAAAGARAVTASVPGRFEQGRRIPRGLGLSAAAHEAIVPCRAFSRSSPFDGRLRAGASNAFSSSQAGMPDPNFRETVVLATSRKARSYRRHHQPPHRPLARRNAAERTLSNLSRSRYSSAAPWRLKACSPYSRPTSFSGAAVPMLPGLYLASCRAKDGSREVVKQRVDESGTTAEVKSREHGHGRAGKLVGLELRRTSLRRHGPPKNIGSLKV